MFFLLLTISPMMWYLELHFLHKSIPLLLMNQEFILVYSETRFLSTFYLQLIKKKILELQTSSIFKQINSVQTKQSQICHLQEELFYLRIEEQLQKPFIQFKISEFEQLIKKQICYDVPNAFWERKKHIISLPYEPNFNETNIPTTARSTQMNFELLEHCKKEIQSLLDKKLIRPSKSPWNGAAFYVNNAAKKERAVL